MTNEEQLKEKKHTIIDASAGTGKTYTICEIVILRLKAGYNIEDFLIMTYTEKAAGELVDRIRKRIKEEISKGVSEEERNNFEKALRDFDYATISTIHGFCQKVLSEYAFECNIPYSQEVNNKNDLLKYVYGDVIFRELIDKINNLEPSEVKKIFSKTKKSFEDTIYNIASKINIDIDKLLLEPNNYEHKINSTQKEILNKIFSVDFNELKEFLSKKTSDASEKLEEYLAPLFDLYKISGIDGIIDYLSNIKNLIFKINNYQVNYLKDCYKLDEKEAKEIKNVFINYAQYVLSFKTQIIKDVTEKYKIFRKNNLSITYNDMISLVALSIKENSQLKDILRKKYKIGIIDEFQDTSPEQWEIVKKIFLEERTVDDILPHHLIIVGDEKQSIYSFQGANVETYKNAKKIMEDDYGAKTIELKDNYRSSKELIKCFNIIFSVKDIKNKEKNFWFDYENVNYPKDSKNNSKEKPLGIFEINNRTEYNEFIVNEIIKCYKKGYNFSEICILIRKGKDADDLKKLFNKKEIPFTHYKKTGIYNSLEGNELFILLKALSFSNNEQNIKELSLTRFFYEYSLKNLIVNDIDMSKIEKKLDNWKTYFQDFGFYYMMEKIFEEQCLFENIIKEKKYIDNSLIEKEPCERSITNFKHLVKKLIDVKDSNSIIDYYNLLDKLRKNNVKEEELQEIDTEEDKVQIMTMHASKGLQYKIVFIYGPFGEKAKCDFVVQKDKKIWSLDKDCNINEFCDEEFIKKYDNKLKKYDEYKKVLFYEELKRLLYVAFTRAEDKLYLPYEKSDENFISEIINPGIDDVKSKYIVTGSKTTVKSALPSSSVFNKQDVDIIDVSGKKRNIKSFSNRFGVDFVGLEILTKEEWEKFKNVSVEEDTFDEDDKYDEGEHNEEINEDVHEKILPKGVKTGLMFHDIFEKINFNLKVSEQEDIIDKIINKYNLNEYKENIYKIVDKTLNTEINSEFKIKDIKESFKEFNFNINLKGKYLTGAIDMLFEYKGKIYILDWKSNSSLSGQYELNDLKNIMNEHSYELQYDIYKKAVNEWLKQNGFKDKEVFGGIYVFLRKAEIGDEAGIVTIGFV